jgi:hypothetical protein
MEMKINKKTKIGKVLNLEKAQKILDKFNFPCIHCPMAKMEMETLEIGQVCEMYGIDCKKLIEELNKL